MGLKQELKENDIVELRNGEIRKIELNKDNSFSVVGFEDYCSLNNYDDNLHYYDKSKKNYDIIKIYKCYKRTSILTDEEKSYLKNLIKPFKKRIDFICKCRYNSVDKEYLIIGIKDEVGIRLPNFKLNEYYAGMEIDNNYSVEELGL